MYSRTFDAQKTSKQTSLYCGWPCFARLCSEAYLLGKNLNFQSGSFKVLSAIERSLCSVLFPLSSLYPFPVSLQLSSQNKGIKVGRKIIVKPHQCNTVRVGSQEGKRFDSQPLSTCLNLLVMITKPSSRPRWFATFASTASVCGCV